MEERNRENIYESLEEATRKHEYLFRDRESLLDKLEGDVALQMNVVQTLDGYEAIINELQPYGTVEEGEFTPNKKTRVLLGIKGGVDKVGHVFGYPGRQVEKGLKKVTREESKVPQAGRLATNFGVAYVTSVYSAKEIAKRFGLKGILAGTGLYFGAIISSRVARRPVSLLDRLHRVQNSIREFEVQLTQEYEVRSRNRSE